MKRKNQGAIPSAVQRANRPSRFSYRSGERRILAHVPFCGVVGAQTEKVVEFFLDREAAEVQEDEERDRD